MQSQAFFLVDGKEKGRCFFVASHMKIGPSWPLNFDFLSRQTPRKVAAPSPPTSFDVLSLVDVSPPISHVNVSDHVSQKLPNVAACTRAQPELACTWRRAVASSVQSESETQPCARLYWSCWCCCSLELGTDVPTTLIWASFQFTPRLWKSSGRPVEEL